MEDFSLLKNKMVFIEGPDFSGKSTLVNELVDYFSTKVDTVQKRQPGATKLGDKMRDFLFNNFLEHKQGVYTDRFLFAVDFVDFAERIENEYKDKFIICDRFTPISNYVYGFYGYNLSHEHLMGLSKMLLDIFHLLSNREHIIISLTLSEEEMTKRYEKRQQEKGEINRIDKEDFLFKTRILAGYKSCSSLFDNVINLSAESQPDVLLDIAKNAIKDMFIRRRICRKD